MAGFLYVNLKGRQPTGIVEPGEYEALRSELAERFLGSESRVRNPHGNLMQLLKAVHKPEELYGCTREDQPWLPDLLLTPQESLAVVRKLRGRRPVRWLGYRHLEGTHRPEGIFIVCGPGIAHRNGLEAHIVDCAPTILAMMGLGVPDDMEGGVISELFASAPYVATQRQDATGHRGATPRERTWPAGKTGLPGSTSISRNADDVYTTDELDKVTERLADLGYLE
jgi:predicted AlkP superfamily phosphohydrolase/phosphomutase